MSFQILLHVLPHSTELIRFSNFRNLGARNSRGFPSKPMKWSESKCPQKIRMFSIRGWKCRWSPSFDCSVHSQCGSSGACTLPLKPTAAPLPH